LVAFFWATLALDSIWAKAAEVSWVADPCSHDLRRGAGKLLNGRGQLLGGRRDLFGGRVVGLARAKLFGQRGERLGGHLALIQRLCLLLNRGLGLGRGGGLLLGGGRHLFGALLRLDRGALSLDRGGQGVIASRRQPSHVLAHGFQRLDNQAPGPRFSRGDVRGHLHGGGDLADVGLDGVGEALDLLGALLGGFGQ